MTRKQHTPMNYWILAVMLALIAGVFFKLHGLDRLPETAPFTYQMELIDPEPGIADTIISGDTVICEAGKQPVGTVAEVRTIEGQVVITIRAEGFPIDGGWRTNVYDILPGFEYDFYTDSVRWYGIVTGIS